MQTFYMHQQQKYQKYRDVVEARILDHKNN